jgi:glycosyltransferase involved in cell wall biosynthesis
MMRIGMMLRAIDEQGGVGVYTRNLVSELLSIDDRNEYVLYYRNPANIGRFARHKNATECLIKGGNKAYWDQVAIPYACWRDKIDLVFHPKFTTPLLAPCKAVMVVHGADWFIPKQAKYYGRIDISYIKLMMPLYFKKASSVLSVSQLTTENFNRALKLDPDKIKTIYLGHGRHFKHIDDRAIRDKVRERYNLPDEFILTLTKHGGGGDRRKNFGRLLQAYACYHSQTANPYSLVVGGKDCHLFRHEYGIPDVDYGLDISFPDWIAQEDLPAVYSLATLYLHPSNLEAFPQPVVEAMA